MMSEKEISILNAVGVLLTALNQPKFIKVHQGTKVISINVNHIVTYETLHIPGNNTNTLISFTHDDVIHVTETCEEIDKLIKDATGKINYKL